MLSVLAQPRNKASAEQESEAGRRAVVRSRMLPVPRREAAECECELTMRLFIARRLSESRCEGSCVRIPRGAVANIIFVEDLIGVQGCCPIGARSFLPAK